MKRLLLLLISFSVSCWMWANDYLMVIDFTDGSEVSIGLSKHPMLTFADQRLCVSVEGEMSEYELADVVNFHFTEAPASIHALREEEDFRMIWQSDDLIVVFHASPEARVLLYGVDGTFYPNRINAQGNRYEISLSDLPRGIYLLNINSNRTLRINRK